MGKDLGNDIEEFGLAVRAARKDAELYLRRCKEQEVVIADLLRTLETIAGWDVAEDPRSFEEVWADTVDLASAAVAEYKK